MRRSQRVHRNLHTLTETLNGLDLETRCVPSDKLSVGGSLHKSNDKYDVRQSDDNAIAEQAFVTRAGKTLSVAPAPAWVPQLLA
jgi:hypothetical protein